MSLKFTKMHGLGNDFVLIDATEQRPSISADLIQKIANRRLGIGFDQLLMIEKCPSGTHDFVYRIFNANGQEVEQCGNGARCVAHYIFTEKLSKKRKLTLATLSGKIELEKVKDGQIRVNMGPPRLVPEKIPFITEKQALQYSLDLDGKVIQFGAVSLGNPHAVFKVDDVFHAPVQRIGQLLQHHPSFPSQVNVGFMQIVSPNSIRLRVFERGVGETRSCGSGACAAVVIGRLCHGLAPDVKVELPGGSLSVNWQLDEADIYLTGPAEKVYKGELLISYE